MMSVGSALRRVSPAAKLFATLPPALALFVTRGVFVPALLIALCVLVLVVFGAVGWKRLAVLLAALIVIGTGGTVLFSLWIVPAGSRVLWSFGPVALSETGLTTGAATTLRLLAIVALMLVSGLTTSVQDLMLALQQQLRVPYRYVYAGRTALVIGPYMLDTLRTIALAHKVRGTVAARGLRGWFARQAAYVVPLMAGGIRRGERLALAMDARAFGIGPRRTERRQLRWRRSDTVFVAAAWASVLVLYVLAARLGLLGTLSLW